MISLQDVQLATNMNASRNEEIIRNVKIILTTPEGTVPFDRNFGVNNNFVDESLELAKAKITTDYIRKIRKYEPRAKVISVSFESDINQGKLIPKVVIDIES